LLEVGFPIRIGIVGGRISNTIQSNIRIVRIFRISGQFHVKTYYEVIFHGEEIRYNSKVS